VHAKTTVLLAVSLLASIPPSAAAAREVAPGGVAELTGPRAMGIDAAVGIASGNDAIYVNPGALSARRRYSAEAQFWVDRRGADNVAQVWSGSVADSLSSPVAAGLVYGKVSDGVETGSLYHLALAGAIAQGIHLGVAGKYYALSGAERVSASSVDAGIFWQVADFVAVGVAGYNLAPTKHPAELPRGVGAGLSIGSDASLHGSFEWKADLDRLGKTTNRYAFGLETLLGGMAPLRAGYVIDQTLDTKWWSVGVGLVSANGGGLDVGYRQSTTDPSARQVAVSVKLQLVQ
jgi:hypothetical protein